MFWLFQAIYSSFKVYYLVVLPFEQAVVKLQPYKKGLCNDIASMWKVPGGMMIY